MTPDRATPTGNSLPPRLPNSVRRLVAARPRHEIVAFAIGAVVVAVLVALLAVILMPAPEPPSDHPVIAAGHRLEPVSLDDIPGWREDDPLAALSAFRRSCGALGPASRAAGLQAPCDAALELAEDADGAAARAFFERHFHAFQVILSDGEGILTAYYEPVVPGSRTRTDRFSVPLLALPPDHVVVGDDNRPPGFDADLIAARSTPEGLVPWPPRGEIEDGALDGIAEPVVFVEDPVDAFFIHIQGSTRIALADGSTMRVGFAGRNGYPYTSVGRVMQDRGIRPEGGLSMDGMRGFFRENPGQGRELMHENRSFIFFREIVGLDEDLGPVGAQGVPLTTGRSLAVDPAFHAMGTPVFVSAELPSGPGGARETFRRLMIAQDTGSAIKGPVRGDLFWGTGTRAGSQAGGIRAAGGFHVLLPAGRRP